MRHDSGVTLSLDDGPKPGSVSDSAADRLVVLLECSRPSARSAAYALESLHTIRLGRGKSRRLERDVDGIQGEAQLTLPDRWMSSRHATLTNSFGRWVLEDCGSKNGLFVNGEPTTRVELHDGDLIDIGHTVLLFQVGVETSSTRPLDIDFGQVTPPSGLETLAPELARQFAQITQVAPSPLAILIQGETGTGKEVLAQAIHKMSARAGRCVAVNCGAIPENLVESELFGYVKGAFSGADSDKNGLVQAADNGTLFLDEIGDLPAPSQAALLRVLQEREVSPVGASRPTAVDLRTVAATHRDLDTLIETSQFRRDLLSRLAGFRIHLPGLRERKVDLGLLIGAHTSQEDAGVPHPGFSCAAIRKLYAYDWPLNIRELVQVLTAARLLAGDREIDTEHLPEEIRDFAPDQRKRDLGDDDNRLRDRLMALMQSHSGNISAVARDMQKDRKQIQRWLKRFGLSANDYRI